MHASCFFFLILFYLKILKRVIEVTDMCRERIRARRRQVPASRAHQEVSLLRILACGWAVLARAVHPSAGLRGRRRRPSFRGGKRGERDVRPPRQSPAEQTVRPAETRRDAPCCRT
jgi:hypothetical protein